MPDNKRSTIPRLFFTKDEIAKISEAISLAEMNTQGELRVHIERKSNGDPLARARDLLKELGIHETVNRTGLLIYITLEDQQLAIFGDEGIHKVFRQDGWNALANELSEHFKQGQFVDGLLKVIRKIGEILSQTFPALPKNVNEIPNEPTFGNE
ncbi:MAG TPA: TPM domain-containing protein [Acidobacteriota bacterium]|nr:TPM domain-containing protein [Acidobacteriota bacterium]